VVSIIDTLIDALRTPSESVQRCVAERLVPLVAAQRTSEGGGLAFLDACLARCVEGETVAERR